MELLTTFTAKKSDIGYNNNYFGGQLFYIIDELLYTKSCELTQSKMNMTKYAEFIFQNPIKEQDIIKIYLKNYVIGNSSIKFVVFVYNFTKDEEVLSSNVTFVKVKQTNQLVPSSIASNL